MTDSEELAIKIQASLDADPDQSLLCMEADSTADRGNTIFMVAYNGRLFDVHITAKDDNDNTDVNAG